MVNGQRPKIYMTLSLHTDHDSCFSSPETAMHRFRVCTFTQDMSDEKAIQEAKVNPDLSLMKMGWGCGEVRMNMNDSHSGVLFLSISRNLHLLMEHILASCTVLIMKKLVF